MDQGTGPNIGDIPYSVPLFLGWFTRCAKVVTHGKGGGFGPAACADLGKNLANVMLGCFRADDEPIGDLAIRETLSDEGQHFCFALSERRLQTRAGMRGDP